MSYQIWIVVVVLILMTLYFIIPLKDKIINYIQQTIIFSMDIIKAIKETIRGRK